ncbi:MAG: heme exporter protein CcmD [Betaproteobacteria bacterium]
MNWGGLDAFLAMGGHGFYVWGSYIVTFALLAIEVARLRRARREAMRCVKPGTDLQQADRS